MYIELPIITIFDAEYRISGNVNYRKSEMARAIVPPFTLASTQPKEEPGSAKKNNSKKIAKRERERKKARILAFSSLCRLVLVVLFWLFFSGCPLLAVLSWLYVPVQL
jgi:hypothetical protein